jgi:Skp family chaperone for outer membrane proteins
MKRLLPILSVLLITFPALAQVSPYPDTSATGSAQEMIQKLSRAQSELDQVGRDIDEIQHKFNAIKPILAGILQEDEKVVQEPKKLLNDFNVESSAFDQGCTTHPMPLNSSEYANCQSWRARLVQKKEDYERRNAELQIIHGKLKARYEELEREQLMYQLQVEKMENWKFQVVLGIRSLKQAIMSQCTSLLSASPEELKLKCGNVQFDGSKSNLRPCTTDACLRARIRDW